MSDLSTYSNEELHEQIFRCKSQIRELESQIRDLTNQLDNKEKSVKLFQSKMILRQKELEKRGGQ